MCNNWNKKLEIEGVFIFTSLKNNLPRNQVQKKNVAKQKLLGNRKINNVRSIPYMFCVRRFRNISFRSVWIKSESLFA